MLELYDYFRSSAAFRVRIALNYKQLDYQKIAVNLRTGEQCDTNYHIINPTELVPSLKDNGSIIHQSLAILEYLEEIYPTPALLPKDSFARAYVREIALNICCEIHPLNNLRVRNYVAQQLQQPTPAQDEWYQHWLQVGFKGLEDLISNSRFYQNEYCFSNQFTLADICLIPQLFNARLAKCDLTAYPTLVAIEHKCLTMDAIKAAWPQENT